MAFGSPSGGLQNSAYRESRPFPRSSLSAALARWEPSLTTKPSPFESYGYMVLSSLSFSCMGAAIRACRSDFSVAQLVFLRSLVTVLILVPFIIRHPKIAAGSNRFWLAMRGVTGTIAVYGFYHALSRLPLGTATVLNQTSPIFSILVVWLFFARAPRLSSLISLAFAFGGVLLLFHPDAGDFRGSGVWAGLSSGLFASISYISIRRMRFSEQGETVVLWFAAVSSLLTLPLCLTASWPSALLPWLFAILAGIFAYGGQRLLVKSLAYLTATAGSTTGLLGSVFASLWGLFAFGERLGPLELAAIALILIGSFIPALIPDNRALSDKLLPFRWQKPS